MNATFKRLPGHRQEHEAPQDTEARLRGIAHSLELLVGELQLVADSHPTTPVRSDDDALDRAIQIYRDRRRREQIFGDATLFGEPAWDILLDLFVASRHEKRIAVTSACIGSAVPATTALRWIKILEERGLIEREVDEIDARRIFVRISPRGSALMQEFLAG
ncbi:helix-turn-helix domain-containing protein [Novosphingobium rosa]|uniref:MarR family transcriptional regulator n=1 Tax=Novosphingobium rosa TaxID=76978 RepID=UPI000B1E81D1|nr:MarR family transcriptional regulator [Novosphingobium rosa]